MSASHHPLDPLDPREIWEVAQIIRSQHPDPDLSFRAITLREPEKDELIRFLEQEASGELYQKLPTRMARVQIVSNSDVDKNQLYELMVDLDKGIITRQQHLEGKLPYIDASYMTEVEKACMADERVQKKIAQMQLPNGASACVEPWAYATDGENLMTSRVSMCWFYMRLCDHPDVNHYAYPLDLCAEVSEDLKVTKIYRLPLTSEERINNEERVFDDRRVHPMPASEYYPKLRPPPRATTKPYHVLQPEGPSFKWRFRVGFNYREGLTLHDIRYEGRSLFYRLSLAEMFVPYADPRAPYPRKGAFDIGNDGAGINANNLKLGCDCLGHIKYFDGWHNTNSGEPLKLPNVICCHEQDDGILWKHTNFRTQNAVVTRSRILVLQTIITVTNYEYIFAFHFGQDASIHYEVRATGILSTSPVTLGQSLPYGTIVAPGVLAPYHQHLFCLRIDPAIDGHENSVVVEESEAMPVDDPNVHNPFGVGYTTVSNVVEHECGLDLDFNKNRVFKIVNENKINPVTKTPVGFKLLPHYSQKLLAHPSSYHAKRSEFGAHAIWVTNYDGEEIFPSGRHTMQSMGGEGIASGIRKRQEAAGSPSPARNGDIVVWHTFGSTHNPRIEDWPVMPAEKMIVGLKPVNFFTGNPGIDVAVSTQSKNNSVLDQREVVNCP
ncbi:copper amine oxidase [Myriangium duriaei CBS 260.36]|uniref:Amine oxidase n=1 Tax=Myriangium duriaei CBS 260.36 TaxID=1168546 RepID=A0A9P4MNM6_9PEZI|nr:copper amine oxidase [Myriangium duriaei CBS 260.36]